MRLLSQQPEEERFDRETLAKVTSLAARLQAEADAGLTVRDMEAAGAELGIRPEMIRRAVALIREEPRQVPAAAEALPGRPGLPVLIPILWAGVTWMTMRLSEPDAIVPVMLLGCPAALALLSGALARRRTTALYAGAAVWVAEWLVMAAQYGLSDPEVPLFMLGAGAVIGAGFGALGRLLGEWRRRVPRKAESACA